MTESGDLLADLTESYGSIVKRLEVGSDISLIWTHSTSDDMVTMRLRHRCDRAPTNRGVIIAAPEIRLEPGWHTIEGAASEVPTIAPSILCDDCGLHGFIRQGRWVSA